MKKILVSKLALISCLLLSATFSSCRIDLMEYNPKEAFYRLMRVERRAKKMKMLTVSKDSEKTEIETNIKDSNGKEIPLVIKNADVYNVLVITDVHFGNKYLLPDGHRRDEEFIKALENTKTDDGQRLVDTIKFAIGLGDFAEHGYLSECQDYNKFIRDPLESVYGIPLYNIVGNHDLYNSGWDNWANEMYPHTSFYKFETPSFSWYFLDSASGTLGEYQYDALESEMYADSKKKLVFSHVPVYADNNLYFTMQNTDERNRLISTCAATSTSYFLDGHSHKERRSDFGAFIEQNISAYINSYEYGILHVNEAEGTVSVSLHHF